MVLELATGYEGDLDFEKDPRLLVGRGSTLPPARVHG